MTNTEFFKLMLDEKAFRFIISMPQVTFILNLGEQSNLWLCCEHCGYTYGLSSDGQGFHCYRCSQPNHSYKTVDAKFNPAQPVGAFQAINWIEAMVEPFFSVLDATLIANELQEKLSILQDELAEKFATENEIIESYQSRERPLLEKALANSSKYKIWVNDAAIVAGFDFNSVAYPPAADRRRAK